MNIEHPQHDHPNHEHGPDCGHTAIEHNGHVDYVHDSHLHHPHEGHYDEHRLEVTAENPDGCVPHNCNGHEPDTCTATVAATKRYRTAIMWTTSWTAICTIRTATTATITARSPF